RSEGNPQSPRISPAKSGGRDISVWAGEADDVIGEAETLLVHRAIEGEVHVIERSARKVRGRLTDDARRHDRPSGGISVIGCLSPHAVAIDVECLAGRIENVRTQ